MEYWIKSHHGVLIERINISWVKDYTNRNIFESTNLMDAVEACRREVQNIEEHLCGIHYMQVLKQKIIDDIESSCNLYDLNKILIDSIKLIEENREKKYYIEILNQFKKLEDKLVTYVLTNEKSYYGYIST